MFENWLKTVFLVIVSWLTKAGRIRERGPNLNFLSFFSFFYQKSSKLIENEEIRCNNGKNFILTNFWLPKHPKACQNTPHVRLFKPIFKITLNTKRLVLKLGLLRCKKVSLKQGLGSSVNFFLSKAGIVKI